MSEQETIAASGQPVTEQRLVADLHGLGVGEGMVVMVHSSLSSLGWVCGGPTTVLRALLHVLGPEGTLVMPAHSADWSDPAEWENPPVPSAWWETIRATMPAFDPAITPTSGIGVIPELFRTWPGVVRSDHPSGSFAAHGPQAQRITADPRLEDPFGDGSPLATIYELGGRILLLGVGHANNTTLHLAERRALGDDQEKIQAGAAVSIDGVREWVSYLEPDIDEDDFEEVGAAFERADTTTRTGSVGRARCKLLCVRSLVDFAVPWFRRHRNGSADA